MKVNYNQQTYHLFEQNQDKIEWLDLCENPNAIHLLEKNQDKIHWNYLSMNANIFTYDKKNLQEQYFLNYLIKKMKLLFIF